MAALSNRAMHEQLGVIMEALTKAAVVEICELVDEGYAALQREINRSRHENETLRKKLHLIESIVIRSGAKTAEPEVVEPAEDAPLPRQRDGGSAAVSHAEFPDVVLIKDEDSDSNDSFGEEKQKCLQEGTAVLTSTQTIRSVKRRLSGNGETETSSSAEHVALKASRRTSASVYAVDSPRCESVHSGADKDVQVVHQETALVPLSSSRHTYFSGSAAEPHEDLDLTWTQTAKSHASFAQFPPSGDGDDAFGLKLVSVSGSAPSDCPLSDGSSSVFEYGDVDAAGFGLYTGGGGGKRFVCSVCHKTYASAQNLEVHMRIHTGERPFSCEQCGKRFTQSAHLKSHVNMHTGERPHVCGVCGRSFVIKHSLKTHMNKCHPDVALTQDMQL